MTTRRLVDSVWLQTTSALLLLGCREPPPESAIIHAERGIKVRAPDAGGACYDVPGKPPGLRVCYASPAADSALRVERTLPNFDASTELGWRCVGAGAERVCRDRALDVGAFVCSKGRCEQEHPRVPDASEWFCSDAYGAELCLKQGEAAGVSIGAPTPGFVCGKRKLSGRETSETLCLDLSPDFPDGDATSWSCHYEGDPSPRRICTRKSVRGLGAVCEKSVPCPLGTLCKAERCLPARPQPECWLDSDCSGRPCRMGACQ